MMSIVKVFLLSGFICGLIIIAIGGVGVTSQPINNCWTETALIGGASPATYFSDLLDAESGPCGVVRPSSLKITYNDDTTTKNAAAIYQITTIFNSVKFQCMVIRLGHARKKFL